MGDLPQALPKTVIAADHVRRHAARAGIQHQATDLLLAAARAESIARSDGRGAVPPHLLSELLDLTSALTGRRWLRANAGSAAVDTFAAVSTGPHSPGLPALDQMLSAVLWSRFSDLGAVSGGSAGNDDRSYPAATRLPRFGARRHRATA